MTTIKSQTRTAKLVAAGILGAYVCATSVCAGSFPDTWISAVLVAPLFFILPTGVGLLLLTWRDSLWIRMAVWSRLQLVYFAGLLGLPAITLFVQATSLLIADAATATFVICTCALAGFCRCASMWFVPPAMSRRELKIVLLTLVLISTLGWWINFGFFSKFPFTDLFAEVHSLKGAREFADTGILNPFVTLSYFPFRPAILGSLAGIGNVDLLKTHWVLTFLSVVYSAGAMLLLARALFPDEAFRRWVAFLLMGLGNHSSVILTNGNWALLGAFLLLAFLIGSAPTSSARGANINDAIGVSAASLAAVATAYAVNQDQYLSLLCVMLAILAPTIGNLKPLNYRCFVAFLAVLLVMLLHRSALLFLTLAIALWWYWCWLHAGLLFRSASLRRPMAVLMVMPVLTAIAALLIAGAKLGYLPGGNSPNNIYSFITRIILNHEIKTTDEISLGVGSDIGLIELTRFGGLIFFLTTTIIFAYWALNDLRPGVATGTTGNHRGRNPSMLRLSWAWTSGWLLCLLMLSGFPFIYRAAPLAIACLSVALTDLLSVAALDQPAFVRRRRLALLSIGVVSALVGFGITSYGVVPSSGAPYSGYQRMFQATLITGIAIAVLACLYVVFSRRPAVVCAVGLIALAIALDRSAFVVRSKAYSFGPLFEAREAISHYDENDLEAALWIRKNVRNALLVSDPYTLGLNKAVTGFATLYLFSNLDTVNPVVASNMRKLLRSVLYDNADQSHAREAAACAILSKYIGNLNDEAAVRFFNSSEVLRAGMRRLNRIAPQERADRHINANAEEDAEQIEQERKRAESDLGRSMSERTVLLIVNDRTVTWTMLKGNTRTSYFSSGIKLDDSVVANLRRSPVRILSIIGGRTIIAEFTCWRGRAF